MLLLSALRAEIHTVESPSQRSQHSDEQGKKDQTPYSTQPQIQCGQEIDQCCDPEKRKTLPGLLLHILQEKKTKTLEKLHRHVPGSRIRLQQRFELMIRHSNNPLKRENLGWGLGGGR